MASVIKTQAGYGVKLSPGENIQRPKIALGKVTKKDATSAKAHIERLIARCKTGQELPTATVEWLSNVPDGLRIRLEKLGLVERSARSRWTVRGWVADYIKQRRDVKPITIRHFRDAERKIVAFFLDDSIGDVTVQHAKNFRIYLKTTCGMGENTIRRMIGRCRQFFNAAIEAGIITKNPFLGQAVSVRPNPSRFFYVTQEMAETVLGACPDAEWRLLFGLCRWGGLRCPSEVVRLRWQDIDFENSRFTVHSPKTEHHIGQEKRVVPMFPELKPLFLAAFDAAPEGAVYCVHKERGDGVNLRTQLTRIIKRAGLEPWPKLFQNLRSTRETELFRLTSGDVKSVCSWLGNSPMVALQHYAQTTEADLQAAAKMTVLNQAEKRVQKTVHTTTETTGNDPQENQDKTFENKDKSFNCGNLHDISEPCKKRIKDKNCPELESNQHGVLTPSGPQPDASANSAIRATGR